MVVPAVVLLLGVVLGVSRWSVDDALAHEAAAAAARVALVAGSSAGAQAALQVAGPRAHVSVALANAGWRAVVVIPAIPPFPQASANAWAPAQP